MSIKHLWSNTNKEEQKYSDENLPHYHFLYHKTRIEDLELNRAFKVISLVVTNFIGRKKQLQWYTDTF